MVEKGVILCTHIVVIRLLERKGVDWNLIYCFLMDVKLSDVCHWQRPKLEENCEEWELSTERSVGE
jgi:hypothetical protein